MLLILLSYYFFKENLGAEAQRHVAALTLLIAFMQLYLLLVRVVPNTPIPIYVNMFTTVLKTYVFILLSYSAFIISFAYSFFLIFNSQYDRSSENEQTQKTTESEDDKIWGSIGYSIVKTLVMFIGEMDYNDLVFGHWLGYVIFILFAFLVVIVLMNILNGLYYYLYYNPFKLCLWVISFNPLSMNQLESHVYGFF